MADELGEVQRIDDNISYAPRGKIFHAELDGMVVASVATEKEARAALEIHKELKAAREEEVRKRQKEHERQRSYK